MNQKLSKNFSFLKIINNLNIKIIENITDSEKFDDPENNLLSIFNALELSINDFINYNNINLNQDIKLFDKIETINNYLNKQIKSAINEIRVKRNNIIHKNNIQNFIEFSIIDVLQSLKNIHSILIYFYLGKDELANYTFDEKIYNLDNFSKKISAITQEQRNEDNFSKDFKQTINLEKDSIKSWLSIKNSTIIVPIYQRKYEWKEENVATLLEDIDKRKQDLSDHYFGIIAQKKQFGKSNNDPNIIKIIDGQQRLTTSILIICAARDIILDNGYKKDKNSISWYNDLISNHANDDDFQSYIKNPGGTEENNKIFYNILIKHINNQNTTNRYYENYKFAYQWMSRKLKTLEEINNFILIFLNNFIVASISFDNNSFSNKKEMEIFENLNSKGLELSIVDLIKNYIFNYCSDNLLTKKENDIPINYNRVLSLTGIKDDKLEVFYNSITEIFEGNELTKNKKTNFAIISKNLSNNFFKDFNNIDSIQEFSEMMKHFMEYIFLFNDIYKGDFHFIKFLRTYHIFSIVHDKKKQKLFFYLIFLIYEILKKENRKYDFHHQIKESKLNKNEIKKLQELFLEVTIFLIKSKIIVNQGDSSIKRFFITISNKYWKKINDLSFYSIETLCEELINEFKIKVKNEIDDAVLYTNLNGLLKPEIAREVLLLIELYMCHNLYDDSESIHRSSQTLEHILPENHDLWINNLSEEEKIKFKNNCDQYKNKLGNFIILTSPENSKIKNKTFLEKQTTYTKKIRSKIYCNENDDIDISRKLNWDFNDIEKRTKALINYIKNNIFN